MKISSDQGVMVRIESISPDTASELLAKSDRYVSEILGMNHDKISHFIGLMVGKGGRWYPTMSAIWIDPDGQLRDGFHRLQAAVTLGCEIEVLVARGATYTPERMSEVERNIRVEQQVNPQFELRPSVPGSLNELVITTEALRAQLGWVGRLAVRLMQGKKCRLKVWAARRIIGMMRLPLRTGWPRESEKGH